MPAVLFSGTADVTGELENISGKVLISFKAAVGPSAECLRQVTLRLRAKYCAHQMSNSPTFLRPTLRSRPSYPLVWYTLDFSPNPEVLVS
ncbi:uncharacterized protein ARMOST_11649 [Armillaria ostoyae]|uniref:Uncharacterized protein n=1 Tax=Armillaria ostoyae TaxID=47428 RepID=A0A284RHR2_ARMOS|nr:uncharacterized protein ARMOST_11649 [Armillaria ostoyae]